MSAPPKMTAQKALLKLRLGLHETQYWALYSPAQETLFGGAAGGGKSYLMRVAAIMWCIHVAGLQVYLFRRTFDDLHKNHMEGNLNFIELLGPLIESGHCVVVKNQIRFWNGANINLCHLQHKNALGNYQGREIHVLLIDEATHFSDYEYRYLRTRCRVARPLPPSRWKFPRVLCGTNPGGKGHHYFKGGFVDNGAFNVVAGAIQRAKKDGSFSRTFIPSKLTDNPSMTENDPDYADRLAGTGDELITKALLDGDWNVIAGATFEKFRTEMHVCDPFPIPWNWPVWRGADDGFAAPASVSWLTQDPLGRSYFVIAELYKAKMTATTFARKTLAIDKAIVRAGIDGRIFMNEEELSGAIDSSAFSKHGESKLSRGKQMNDLGARWRPVTKKRPQRVADVQNMQRLLDVNKGDPGKRAGIMFFRYCRQHIKAIPAIMRDDVNPEDVDTDDPLDHVWDGLRYGLSYKPGLRGTVDMAG